MMKRIEHRDKKWVFPFVEYSCSLKNKKLPMIIQLHGVGERGNGEDELGKVDVHGFSKCLEDAEYECIVIMPQCPKNTFWSARVESIVKFIEQLIKEYDADERRIYLTGLSMGGYGTWFTAMERPDLFAAIAPVCGGGIPGLAGGLKMPVWVFHGSEDKIVNPVHSDEMVLKLRELGTEVIYTKIDGVGHDVWENAYNERLLKWLLSKSRK